MKLLPPPGPKNDDDHAKRSSKAEVQRRVSLCIEMLTLGAEFKDLVEYGEKQGWGVKKGAVFKYLEAAYAYIKKTVDRDRDRVLSLHERQRRRLFSLAMAAGKYELALLILQDLAKLQGLYEDKGKGRFHGESGADHEGDTLLAELQAAVAELRRRAAGEGGTIPDGPPTA